MFVTLDDLLQIVSKVIVQGHVGIASPLHRGEDLVYWPSRRAMRKVICPRKSQRYRTTFDKELFSVTCLTRKREEVLGGFGFRDVDDGHGAIIRPQR